MTLHNGGVDMGFDFAYPFQLIHWKTHEWITKQKKKNELKKRYQGQFREKRKQNPRTVYLVMTPEHENLGDHAIALAETEFLRQHGVDYVEITGLALDELQRYGLLGIMNGSPILMQGGGYLGTLWFHSEEVLRDILKQNPRSTIIALPNTIYYEQSPWGQEELQKSITIYGQHEHLYLYAREKTSFDAMRQIYRNVKCIPDMVFSMNLCGQAHKRKGCLLSLRHDCERTRTDGEEMLIRRQAKELFGDAVKDSDMVADVCIPVDRRVQALQAKFAEFASARLVITDRLHGMVFCAITGTPCVVLNSKSHKVQGCYEWIRGLEYIRFAEDATQITEAYQSIPDKEFTYDNTHLLHYYQELADDMETILHWK